MSAEDEDWDAEFGASPGKPLALALPPQTPAASSSDPPPSPSSALGGSSGSGTLHRSRSARAYSRHGRRASFISASQAADVSDASQQQQQQQPPQPSSQGQAAPAQAAAAVTVVAAAAARATPQRAIFDETEVPFERGMAPQKIRGIHANPDQKEAVDDDFALPDDGGGGGVGDGGSLTLLRCSAAGASTLDLLGTPQRPPKLPSLLPQQQQQQQQSPPLSRLNATPLAASGARRPATAAKPEAAAAATATPAAVHEEREVADTKFLLSCLPPIDAGSGVCDSHPVWQLCTPQAPLPPWFDAKKPAHKEENVVQALGVWKSALALLDKGQLPDALRAFTRTHTLLEESDPFAREQDFDLFLAVVLLHASRAAFGLADIFKQTEFLKQALDLLPETSNSIEANAARAAINYELASCLVESNSLHAAAQPAIRFLRYTVLGGCTFDHIHSRKCVGRSIRWANVARACYLVGRCLTTPGIKGKCMRRALKAARISKEDGVIAAAAPIVEGGHAPSAAPLPISAVSLSTSPAGRTPPPVPPQQFQRTHRRSDSAPVSPLPVAKGGSARDSGTDTADTERSEAEEDWDAEFGIEPETRSNPICLSLATAPSATPQAGFASKHKVLEAVLTKPIQLVRFPPPTYLFSMKTATGFSFFHAEDLEVWLATIVMKHVEANRVFPVRTTTSLNAAVTPMQEEQRRFFSNIHAFPKFSVAWMSRHIMWAQMLLSKGDTATCWETLSTMFAEIKTYIDAVQANAEKRDKSKLKELFEMCLEALSLSALQLWTIDRSGEWAIMSTITKSLYPAYASLVDILENEIYAEVRMNADPDEMEKWEARGFRPSPVQALSEIYRKESEKERASATGRYAGTIRSRGPPAAMAEALLAIHCVMGGMAPLSLVSKAQYEEASFEECREPGLATSTERLAALNEIYFRIPEGNTKAKAALILGKAAEAAGDWATAEKLLFESVFILDTYSRGVPAIVSEIGVKALTVYGDVLLHNSKYQYAISCYEAAILLSDLSKRKDYFALARRVAEIAHENDDIERCINLYNEVINKYLAKGKANEAVFVSNLLADLHKDRGDFTEAELTLTRSLEILLDHTRARSVVEACANDPQFFNLQLKLAELFLDSYHFERGIELLEMLNLPSIPKRRREMMLPLLARAYAKKGWLRDATDTIAQIPVDVPAKRRDSGSASRALISSTASSTSPVGDSISAAMARPASEPPRQQQQHHHQHPLETKACATDSVLEHLETIIRAYWFAGKNMQCLYATEHAIELCSEALLTTRGHLFYRRAKILHRIFNAADAVHFPSPLSEPVPEISGGSSVHVPSLVFSAPTDVLQEAAASYRKAYQYFLAAGDDTRIARAMARLAKLYLDHVFPAVVVFHMQLDDVSRMPLFNTSAIPPLGGGSDFTINIDTIDNPASVALDIATETYDVKLLPHTLLNLAELRLLQGDRESAVSYWKECRDMLWQMYMDGPMLILRTCPAYIVAPVVLALQRLVRFLLCLGKEVINHNLVVLDACILAQMDLQQVVNRQLRTQYVFADMPAPPSKTPASGDDGDEASVQQAVPSKTIRATPFKPAAPPPAAQQHLLTPQSPSQFTSPIRRLPNLTEDTPATPQQPPLPPQPLQPLPPHPSQLQQQQQPVVATPLGRQASTTAAVAAAAAAAATTPASAGPRAPPDECGSVYQHELTAEQLWGLLFCMKSQSSKYSGGKLSKSELSTRNQALMRDILRVTSAGRVRPSASGAIGAKGSPVAIASARMNPTTPVRVGSLVDPLYRVEDFCSRHPDIAQKLVYVLHLDPIIAYYSPSSGQLHFDIIRSSSASLKSADAFVPQPSTPSGTGRALLIRIHMLMNPEQYAFLNVSPDATLSDLLEELCRVFNEGLCTPVPQQSQQAPSPAPSPTPPSTPQQPSSSSSSAQQTGTPKAARIKYLGSSALFAAELSKLAEKLQAESTGGSPANPLTLHHRTASGRCRLRPKQLALAKVPQSAPSSAGLRFAPLSQPRSAAVGSCFSARDLHIQEGQPVGLYLYGAASQSLGPTASTVPISISPAAAAFIAGMISPQPTRSSSSSDPTPEELRTSLEVFGELSTTFTGLIDMLPIRTESPIASSSSSSSSAAAAATTATGGSAVKPTPSKSRFSLKELFSSSKDKERERAESSFVPVARQPTVLICSQSLQALPWEMIIPDDPVVRYLSFFDLANTLGRADSGHKSRYVPAFVSCYYSAGERTISDMEERRRAQLALEVPRRLHVFAPPASARPTAGTLQERGRECAIVSFFACPLVEHGKRVSLLKKKYKYVSFFDICKLETDPDEISTFVERATVGFFPVLLITYADLADPPEVLASLLRRRPSCAVIAVPSGKLKATVQRLMHIHEEFFRAQQRMPDIHSRYQFLLGTLAALRRGDRTLPIAVLNPPAPVVTVPVVQAIQAHK